MLMREIETTYPEKYTTKSLDENSRLDKRKRKFNWSVSNIKWFLDAEETTDFYTKAIEQMDQYITDSKTAVDIGCGIGTFSINLAKLGIKVTAIDMSPKVIESLKKRLDDSCEQNIDTLSTPFEFISNNKRYDIVLMSYTMGLINRKNIMKILHLSNKHIFLVLPVEEIKNDFCITEFYEKIGKDVGALKQQTYKELLEILNQMSIDFELRIFESEFGQPFDSVREACDFMQYYFKIPLYMEEELMEWINEKLIIKNGRYYLPNKKTSCMIIINSSCVTKLKEM